MPRSKSRRDFTTRKSERICFSSSHLLGCSIQSRCDGRCEPVPAFGFLAQAAAPGRGQGVIFGAAVVIADAPFGGDEVLVFQAVEGGIQGSLGNFQRVAGDLLDAQQHAVTVQRLQRDGFENQHVECSRQQVRGFAHGDFLPVYLGVYTESARKSETTGGKGRRYREHEVY